jgi:hypothetical protein
VKFIYVVIGALLLLAVGVLIGLELQSSSGQQAAPTTSTGPNYGKVSCAAGGCTVWGPCPNDVPPQSHWNCTGSITQEEFDQHIQPQLDAEARQNGEKAVRLWREQNGGPLTPRAAEELCATAFGWEDPYMTVDKCVELATQS